MDNIKKILPYILVLILLWTSVKTMNQVENLEQKLNHYKNEISSISNNMNNIRRDIQKDLDEDNLVESFEYEIVGKYEELAIVSVDVALNKFRKGSKVFVSYEAKEFHRYDDEVTITMDVSGIGETNRIELKSNDQMLFTGQFEASKMLEYDLRLIVESDDYIETTSLSQVNLYYKFYPDVEIRLRTNEMKKNGEISYFCGLSMFGRIDMEITSAKCSLKYKGKAVDTFDLIGKFDYDKSKIEDMVGYEVDREYTVLLDADSELSFEDVTIEMIVETDAGITYSQVWDTL